jgi:hypothetical protein
VIYKGKPFRLRELTEEEGVDYELALQDKKGKFDIARMRRALIAYCLVDDDGNRVFDDPDKLKTMRRSLASFLFQRCQALNNYDENELEGLIKNSEEVGS